jgi:hypothetical protein
MDRAMQTLLLVALMLYIAPAAFGARLTDAHRGWMRWGAVACLVAGAAIALVETALWFLR